MKIRARSIKLTAMAALVPIGTCLAATRISLFTEYPGYSMNFWLVILVFYFPFIILAAVYVFSPKDSATHIPCRVGEGAPVFGKISRFLFFFLTATYIAFVVYRYVILGSVLELGITGARYDEIERGGGVGGIFTGVTILTSAAPVFLFLSSVEYYGRSGRLPLVFMGVASLGILSSFLSGGRNTFFINVSYIYFAGLLSPSLSFQNVVSGGAASKALIRWLFFLFLFMGVVFSLYIFLERALIRSDDLIYRATMHALENGFQFDEHAVPAWVPAEIFIVLFYLHAYLTLAFAYMSLMLDAGLPNGHLMGGYNFYVYALILERVLGVDVAPNLLVDLPVVGAYYTLAGSIYVDFGLVGVFFWSFTISALALISLHKIMLAKIQFVPVGALFLTVLAFSPLYNAASLGSGTSLTIFSLLLFVFLGRRFRRST